MLYAGICDNENLNPDFGVTENMAVSPAAAANEAEARIKSIPPHALAAAVPVVTKPEPLVNPTTVTFAFDDVAVNGDGP
jgi:hypothetical protein